MPVVSLLSKGASSPAAVVPPRAAGVGRDARAGLLATLRRRIEAVERPQLRTGNAALGLGLAAIDEALPEGGLRPAALHEIAGAAGPMLAFAALLAGRRLDQAAARPVLWCTARVGLYPPGLAAFGLDPERLLLVRAGRRRQLLWAMEEALASGRVALVLGEAGCLDLTESRRLQLAAEGGGTPALLLGGEAAGASAAVTRWRVQSAPSGPTAGYRGLGRTRLRLELRRCRGGRLGAWLVEWDNATHTFTMAAVLGDGPALPEAEAVGA